MPISADHRGSQVSASAASSTAVPQEGLPGNVFHQGAKALSWLEGRPSQRANDRFLHENFGPVYDELYEENLEVEGELPAALNGAFARNGPNPYFTPTGGYHWFDGDGMMHVVRIKDGKASYCNRFVNTLRLQQEKAAGHPVSIKIGDLRGTQSLFHVAGMTARGALNRDFSKVSTGTGNTALVFHAKKLLALHEADCPYHMRILCDGILETMQRYTFEGQLKHSFTAHPKVDRESGHMFFFGYSSEKPHVQYSVADATGHITHNVAFNLREPIMMHDFAVSQDYAIFLDVPLFFRPQEMISKDLSTALPWQYHQEAGARIGLLPKYATDASQLRWFDLPGFFAFHTANAWQEGPLVHLYLAAFDKFDLDFWNAGGRFPTADPKDGQAYLSEIILNTETGEASRHRVTADVGEFPGTAPHVSGRQNQFVYMPTNDDSKATAQSGAIKVDVLSSKQQVVGRISFGDRCFGGELVFVPRQQDISALQGEDDGYLMTFVYDEPKQMSFFVVYDAHTFSSKPVARVPMPQRVPFGFHGMFLSEQQLQSQDPAPRHH
ncbi:hypothetical protein WJX74_006374 [Apatococcus lobatus]|uniref:carotenoid 9,10-dioxygenase n=1 Tax=Apatococcus lobatus TaxID=904363 RepID=A0AAW1Q4X2_9CHLO